MIECKSDSKTAVVKVGLVDVSDPDSLSRQRSKYTVSQEKGRLTISWRRNVERVSVITIQQSG